MRCAQPQELYAPAERRIGIKRKGTEAASENCGSVFQQRFLTPFLLSRQAIIAAS